MGDIVELTVTHKQPLFYYEIGERGIWFDIKTQETATVGLAYLPGKQCQYVIIFTNPGKITIFKESSEYRKDAQGLPFTLSDETYCRFWVALDHKLITIGIGNSSQRVITFEITSELNYITFTTTDILHPSSFKFEVPPMNLKIPRAFCEPKVTRGKPQWKQYDNGLPDESVAGGYLNGEVVYVIRARHGDSLTPGMFVPSRNSAYIPWGGAEHAKTSFEVLCGYNLKWKYAAWNKLPVDTLVAGYTEHIHEPLYIGRARYQGHLILGKVQMSHKVCYIAHGGREIALKDYEVLTEPGLNARCANEYITTEFSFSSDD